jgi:hypothetical protein
VGSAGLSEEVEQDQQVIDIDQAVTCDILSTI